MTDNTPIAAKVAHVRKARQSRLHECHWPGCTRQVPPAMWGCKQHWYALPAPLRARVWKCYRPGQEKDMRPSSEYLAVARQVQEWIAAKAAHEVPVLPSQPAGTTAPVPDPGAGVSPQLPPPAVWLAGAFGETSE